jgi:hypothetical protein
MDPNTELELLYQLHSTPQIFEALEGQFASELAAQQELRKHFDADLVRAACALREIRQQAEGLLPEAGRLWLTRTGLEQATAWDVAAHKSQRFPADVPLMDLCSGIGVDTSALLKRGPVTSVDINPSMLQRCVWNVEMWNPDAQHQAVATDVHSLRLNDTMLHLDPDRRTASDRPTKRLEQYSPNLDWMQQLIGTAAGGAIKLGPASNFMQKFPGCEIELISLHGECREATVWFGELASESPFRATVLPSAESLAADPLSVWKPPVSEVGTWIFDPDPAVVRSGLLDVVADRFDLERLDDADEYLTGSQRPNTAFVKAFEVETVLGSNEKELKRYLKKQPSSQYEIKCRRVSVNADAIRRRLPVGDAPPRTILFVRVEGKVHIVIARRHAAPL